MFIEHILISTKKIKIDEQFNKIYIVREFEPVVSICHAWNETKEELIINKSYKKIFTHFWYNIFSY